MTDEATKTVGDVRNSVRRLRGEPERLAPEGGYVPGTLTWSGGRRYARATMSHEGSVPPLRARSVKRHARNRAAAASRKRNRGTKR